MKNLKNPVGVTVVTVAVSCLLGGGYLSHVTGDVGEKNIGGRSFSVPEEARESGASLTVLKDRAFWGAPSPMPHRFSIEWDSDRCLTCHAAKNEISRRQQAISPLPHAHLSQCQQCHVRVLPGDDSLFKGSDFVGVASPGKGSRATPTSPPTIPHQTFMRENCLSCHGPGGEQRVTTPHPYRSQCQQCHVTQIDRQYSRFPLR